MKLKNKKSDRVFIILGGKSCLPSGLFEFLKNEYVIGCSQWALLYEKYPFDFYYVNDLRQMSMATINPETLFNFFQTDHIKWVNYLTSEGWYGTFFKEFEQRGHKLGKYTYDSEFVYGNGLDDAEFLVDGKMSVTNPYEYFSDEWFSKYKIQRNFVPKISGTDSNKQGAIGGVMRCATDLAYFLRFKKCYLINTDPVPTPGPVYNEYITSVYDNNKPHDSSGEFGSEGRVGFTIEDLKSGNYSDANAHNTAFPIELWKQRISLYNNRGLEVRRVVSRESYEYEKSVIHGEFKIEDNFIEKYKHNQGVFKTVFYEDLVNDEPEIISEINYHDWVV